MTAPVRSMYGGRQPDILPRLVPIGAPGVGVQWSYVVPGGSIYYLQTAFGQYFHTNSGAAATVSLEISYDGTTYFHASPGGTQGINSQVLYSWAINMGANVTTASSSGFITCLPNVPLLPGWKISVVTANSNVDDHWAQVALYFLDVPQESPEMVAAERLARQQGRGRLAYPNFLKLP